LLSLVACDKPISQEKAATVLPVVTFEQLVKKSHCLACHAPDNQMHLPDWKQVANEYKGNSEGAKKVRERISHGGSGTWGKMDMPPYPELSEADLDVLVSGILAF